jgi:hypothetical protein
MQVLFHTKLLQVLSLVVFRNHHFLRRQPMQTVA